MELKTVQTQKIYKNIVEQIVNLIHDGSLKKGDKLPPERTLAEMLNVSRTSVREALKVMEIMGIIEIRPGEGTVSLYGMASDTGRKRHGKGFAGVQKNT